MNVGNFFHINCFLLDVETSSEYGDFFVYRMLKNISFFAFVSFVVFFYLLFIPNNKLTIS